MIARRFLLLMIVLAAAGCAGRTSRAEQCQPVPEDQWISGLPVYRECSVDRAARATGTAPLIQYTPSGGQSCVRTVVDVVVDTAGRMVAHTARAVRSTDAGLLQAVLASLDARRYEPAQRDGRAVPQIVRVDVALSVRTVVVSADAPPPRPPRRPPC